MQHNRESYHHFGTPTFGNGGVLVEGFGGERSSHGGFGGGGGFGGVDQNLRKYRLNGRVLNRQELKDEFKPEFTDEKRNEWLKWIDERSKRYSIEATIIVPERPKDIYNLYLYDPDMFDQIYEPDIYVYATIYGTLEVQEQFVENYVTKPVDEIMESRGLRCPLVIQGPEIQTRRGFNIPVVYDTVYPSTDPPMKEYDLMDLCYSPSKS